MHHFFLYLSIGLAALSGAFNFFLFEKLFSSVPAWVSGLAAVLVAGLMYGMLWRIEDRDNRLVWFLCAKVSILTTIGAIFLSQVASTHAQDTAQAHKAVQEYQTHSLEQDSANQSAWINANRLTHASNQQEAMDSRLEAFTRNAEQLEQVRNGDALMAESMDRLPDGVDMALLVALSLLLAVLLDLGAGRCVKIYREMEKEPIRHSQPKAKVYRTKNGSSFDTGTAAGQNGRYKNFIDALHAGEVNPSIRSVKKEFACGAATATGYLRQACEDGVVECTIDKNGRKVYRYG